MGTRGILRVHSEEGVVGIYIHSDMYPEGLAMRLFAFKQVYPDFDASIRGIDYWVANFVFFEKLYWLAYFKRVYPHALKKDFRDLNARHWLGIGVLPDPYADMDQDWEYDLYLPEEKIVVKDVCGGEEREMSLEEFFEEYLTEGVKRDVFATIEELLRIYEEITS